MKLRITYRIRNFSKAVRKIHQLSEAEQVMDSFHLIDFNNAHVTKMILIIIIRRVGMKDLNSSK
jgi:hypothetical protein